mgnify:CR=1 FL=1
MKPKFKPGDSVRAISEKSSVVVGNIYTINKIKVTGTCGNDGCNILLSLVEFPEDKYCSSRFVLVNKILVCSEE